MAYQPPFNYFFLLPVDLTAQQEVSMQKYLHYLL